MISRRDFLRLLAGLGVTGVSTVAYGFGVAALRLQRHALQYCSRRNGPPISGCRIAVIADLHACDPWMSLERIEAIVARTNALSADLIVLLGDYVAGHAPCDAHHSGRRMGDGARRAEGAARRPCGARQPRLVGRQDRAARRAGGPTIARRALEAAGIPVYENDAVRLTKAGRPFWLAGLGDQLAYLAGAAVSPGQPHRRRRSRRDAGESDRRRAGHSAGPRARRRRTRAGARRAAAVRPYPWRAGAAVRLVAGRARRVTASARLWPHPRELRRRRVRRARLQHHAVPLRRAAGDRAGDAGRASACVA